MKMCLRDVLHAWILFDLQKWYNFHGGTFAATFDLVTLQYSLGFVQQNYKETSQNINPALRFARGFKESASYLSGFQFFPPKSPRL